MISLVLSFLGSMILKVSSNSLLVGLGEALKNSSSNQAQVDIARVTAELESRKIAKEIRLATASYWEMRLLAFLIAGAFTLHLVAVALDTVFQFGWAIPKFPAPMDQWEGLVLLSFFGVQAVNGAVRGIASAIIRRNR